MTQIDGSFVQEIAKLAEQACSDRVHTKAIGANPREYLLVKADGEHELHDVPPPYRNHNATRIEDLAKLQTAISPGDDADKSPAAAFYDAGEIVLVFDHEDGRDSATMPLICPEVFDRIRGMIRGQRFDQKNLVDLLAFDFHGALNNPGLVDIVRKINFSSTQSGSGVVNETSVSIDRSIKAELTGAGEIPDHFFVTTPVFSNPGIDGQTTIKVRLACNPDDQTFMVRPYPGEIENAIATALDQVAEQIAELLPNVLAVRGSFDDGPDDE